jgi:beta-1,4-mannosyl-glycoprotein beta-1,4-N-acetylglucosaminyltransferase
MLFDCFMYFDEEELLELRVEMLKDIVDGFIIADANLTFKGESKDFTCVNTIRKLGLPEDKIQVLHCELPPADSHPNPWVREYAQRDALGVGMRMCPPDSVFFISDVDEIPKPSSLLESLKVAKENPEYFTRLSMAYLAGYADLQVTNPKTGPLNWPCGVTLLYEHLKDSITQIYSVDRIKVLGDCDAGWHFTWMGDAARRKHKITSFSHCYDSIPNAHAPSYSKEMLDFLDTYEASSGSTDPLGRKDHILQPYPHELLPKELFKLDRVKTYLLPDNG